MAINETRCIRCVDGCVKLVKFGKTKSGNQRYICKACNKTRVGNYIYRACKSKTNSKIILLTKEGLGIRSTARILKISTTTLLKRIVSIAKSIHQPIIGSGQTYEVDEMCTFIGHKRNFIWLVYALEKETKNVVSFNVGKRTNKTLSRVLDTLKLSEALFINPNLSFRETRNLYQYNEIPRSSESQTLAIICVPDKRPNRFVFYI